MTAITNPSAPRSPNEADETKGRTGTALLKRADKLFDPVDIAPLVFFRVLFGLLGFADVIGVWVYYHLYKGSFEADVFHFKYMGFGWVPVLPEPFLSLLFWITAASAIYIILGKNYRVNALIFALGFTWLFLLEKVLYLNHGYLFCWISWIMIFLPANRQWSCDVIRNPSRKSDTIERWSLWLLPFLMGVVYFYGGLAKINSDWLHGLPLAIWLKGVYQMPLLGGIWRQEITPVIMAWGGMILDLSAPFLLLFNATRKWIFGVILCFHCTNLLIFQIGIFPWLSVGLSLLFFPPSDFRRWFFLLRDKVGWLNRIDLRMRRVSVGDPDDPIGTPPAYPRKPVLFFLFLIVLFHLLVPLRHHFLSDNVTWTEAGHRFSWRMMLRTKRGDGTITVYNPETGHATLIDPGDYLTGKQARKLMTRPDLIWQFAQHLEEIWKEKGEGDVAVYANVKIRLNGRTERQFTDPTVDLTEEKWRFFGSQRWIMPFVEEKTWKGPELPASGDRLESPGGERL